MSIAIEKPVCWSGLDVGKASFDAALADGHARIEDVRRLPAATFARTEQGVEQFVAWLDARVPAGASVRVAMEATGAYSAELCGWLTQRRAALAPAIAPPRRTADFIKSLGLRNKTDRLEARALSLYGRERTPAPYESPGAAYAELRALLRYRGVLVAQRVAEEHRLDQPSLPASVHKLLNRRVNQLARDIEGLQARMKKCIAADAALATDHALLQTLPGVGFLVAATILGELGDLRRFTRARQLSAFAGVNPSIRQSGAGPVHAHLCKQGNAHARRALYLAACAAIRGDNGFAQDYQRLTQNGKPPKVALGALMRKILCTMRALLISQQKYHPLKKTVEKTTRNPQHEH